MALSKKEITTELAQIYKKLSRKDLKAKEKKITLHRRHYLRSQLKKTSVLKTSKSVKNARKNKAAEFDLKQGMLPHFLEQMNSPNVHELVTQLFFETLRKGLEQQQSEHKERKLKAV